MGRYFSGDIEGKFWFAVQSSDDGEFFGATEVDSSVISYYASDLKRARDGLKECRAVLGEYRKKLNAFFKDRPYYNDEEIEKSFEITKEKVQELLKWYARYRLGLKIYKCIKENGECNFEAEC